MSEKQSYRDSDDMPTERAVLEREWKAMRLALSTPRAALAAQPGSVPAKNNDVDLLLRAVFELCEATEEAPEVAPRNEHQHGFDRGRRFEAKQIRRAIGDWFQWTFCGRSFMGEPVLAAAPTEAKPEPAPGYCKHCKQYTIEEPLPAQQDAVDAAYEACAQIAFDADHMGSVNMKLMKNRIGNAIRAAVSAKKVGAA